MDHVTLEVHIVIPTLVGLPENLFIVAEPADDPSDGTSHRVRVHADADSHRVLRVWTSQGSADAWLSMFPDLQLQLQVTEAQKLALVMFSLIPDCGFGHFFVDPESDDETFFARDLCVLNWTSEHSRAQTRLVRIDLPNFTPNTWKQIRVMLEQRGRLCPPLLDYIGRTYSLSLPVIDLIGQEVTLQDISDVCADFANTLCARCGRKVWTCEEFSANKIAVKWKCSFCGNQVFLRTQRPPRVPFSDLDSVEKGMILQEMSAVCADFVNTPCGRCREKAWECLDVSPSQTAAKYRCSFCGNRIVVRMDRPPRVPFSDSRPVIPKAIQHDVWRRDEGRCTECGSRERLEFDHVIPLALGGSNTARNIQLLCERCNRRKRDTEPGSY